MYRPPGTTWALLSEELNGLNEQGLIEWSPPGNPRKIVYADQVAAAQKNAGCLGRSKTLNIRITLPKNLELFVYFEASKIPGDVVMDFFALWHHTRGCRAVGTHGSALITLKDANALPSTG